jgi:hypothetical protein
VEGGIGIAGFQRPAAPSEPLPEDADQPGQGRAAGLARGFGQRQSGERTGQSRDQALVPFTPQARLKGLGCKGMARIESRDKRAERFEELILVGRGPEPGLQYVEIADLA